jgi:hypothetical protein
MKDTAVIGDEVVVAILSERNRKPAAPLQQIDRDL